ncbi:glucose-6-phosphate isomerase [Sphingomonas ginkgonis]|nr:glucose-6-phosphate isomerase [Sphingomonas ginkgonis]
MPSTDWTALETLADKPLEALFEGDGQRLRWMAFDAAGLHFDFTKTHLDQAVVAAFVRLAEQAGFKEARERLFSGAIVNPTEGRPAEHPAERGEGSEQAVELAGQRHARMRAVVDAIEAGAFGDVTGVLHIGIGGSALGPALLVDALGREEESYRVSVLSNIDGQSFDEAVRNLDPQTTLVVVASKTFTTAETLRNAESALEWLTANDVADPYGRVIAVTAAPAKAVEWGVDETRVLPFGESVGGRYSLWSAVGFSAALALGVDAFSDLLDGAAEMDQHFRLAPPEQNAPMLAAFGDLYYAQKRGAETRAIFAYDDRLRLLTSYVQQLSMESNGKSVTADGAPLGRPSGSVVWGGVGTDAQHAVFQLLHQGTHLVPVEFVAAVEADDGQDPAHHRELLLNCFAQAAALMKGRKSEQGARDYPGDRPSTTILLSRLEPRSLGALLAYHEHRTFTEAVLLGINPFDQYGVELGKEMARAIDDPETRDGFDPSTRALIERAGL